MVKILETKLSKKLRKFTLQNERHKGHLQIFEKISCIKVNRFDLMCQRVNFRGRQISAYLGHFYSFAKDSKEDVHLSNSFQR